MKFGEQEAYWSRARYSGPTDPLFLAYARPKLDRIERVLPLAGRSVLDVGCGPGTFTSLLSQRAGRVVGCDRSELMLSRAPVVEGVELVQADAVDLPFETDSFDVAFEANLLHHLDRPQRAVAEMARVAREAIVLLEPNVLNPVMLGWSLLIPAERGGLRSTRGRLARLLRAAGAQVTHTWTTGMISQNNTPGFLIPLLKVFDIDFALGEYHLLIARPEDSHRG